MAGIPVNARMPRQDQAKRGQLNGWLEEVQSIFELTEKARWQRADVVGGGEDQRCKRIALD